MISLSLGHRAVLDALNRLGAALTPEGIRPVMKEIREDLIGSTRARFQTSTAPDGSRWEPLAASTVLARLSKKRGATLSMRPLIDTGKLSSTITGQITDGGAGLVIGTNRVFGKGRQDSGVHQFGTAVAGRNRNITIPDRPFLGLSAADEQTVLDVIGRALGEEIR